MIQELQKAKMIIDTFPGWLRDSSLPLEWRDDAFHKYYTLLKYKCFVDNDFLSLTGRDDDISLYDDVYIEKYESIDYLDLIKRLSEKFNLSEKVVQKMTEYAVTSGYRGFVNYW